MIPRSRFRLFPAPAILVLLLAAMPTFPEAKPGSPPVLKPQLDPRVIRNIDAAVAAAIEAKEVPGAVVLVGEKGAIVFQKAYGFRSLTPEREPMTLDTIFDMASLTKVMATAPSIMTLVDRGLIRLDDRVKRYLPGFSSGGLELITVRQLLTHYSGLRPDFDLSVQWEGYETAIQLLSKETTQREPGKEFVYSDLNFIALGEIVRVLSGKPLDAFAAENIYRPLGMNETAFNPPPAWRSRIAPTESRHRSIAYLKGSGTDAQKEGILRGEVHDPTAWRMGGVAGHAGLFSTARDAAAYASMLLAQGSRAGKIVLSHFAVQAMTSPQSPRGALSLRGLGWDIETSYSSPRGDLLPAGYGHTGFTGTSLWVYPPAQTFVVILSNRVHPDGKGDATHLRGVVANVVAASLEASAYKRLGTGGN
jgi:CubicO group peptidase (beta-lactamase class C family)